VLVYGASGAVGTNAVQLAARHFGAEVTGVCSAANLELVRSLGARRALDYAVEDFTESGETYDVVFDAVGKLSPAQAKRARTRAGTCLNVHKQSSGGHSADNLQLLTDLAEAGILRPVIDRTYPLERIVEAHRYVDGGHKRGNVAVAVDPGDGP
jgi:NADPH:quinone reductase-like Zn-dependent oxidoreductase